MILNISYFQMRYTYKELFLNLYAGADSYIWLYNVLARWRDMYFTVVAQ